MQATGVSPLDLAIIALLLISAFFAFLRGFTKEVLSLLGWAGAAVATLVLFDPLKPLARGYLSPNLLADAVTGVGIFLVTLLVLSIIGHAIASRVRDSAIGPLDRSLGFLFGLLRGAVVVCIAYLLVSWVVPDREQPAWLAQARTLPLLKIGSEQLLTLLPEDARARSRAAVDGSAERARQGIDAANAIEGFTKPQSAQSSKPDSPDETGYKNGERRSLDTLIRSNQDR